MTLKFTLYSTSGGYGGFFWAHNPAKVDDQVMLFMDDSTEATSFNVQYEHGYLANSKVYEVSANSPDSLTIVLKYKLNLRDRGNITVVFHGNDYSGSDIYSLPDGTFLIRHKVEAIDL